jgi:hypothetical protein
MGRTIDLKSELGASAGESVERLILYIPTRNRHGVKFDASIWIEEAFHLLSGKPHFLRRRVLG